jgi:hypothetical protein
LKRIETWQEDEREIGHDPLDMVNKKIKLSPYVIKHYAVKMHGGAEKSDHS